MLYTPPKGGVLTTPGSPVSGSQTRIVPSQLPDTRYRPSGEYLTLRTLWVWPSKTKALVMEKKSIDVGRRREQRREQRRETKCQRKRAQTNKRRRSPSPSHLTFVFSLSKIMSDGLVDLRPFHLLSLFSLPCAFSPLIDYPKDAKEESSIVLFKGK